jgi:hypothetical protein
MGVITKQLIDDLGVIMSDQNLEVLSEHFETTLDNRVVDEIAQELNVDQLKQLNAIREQGTDEELGEWLKRNVPDLKEIIDDETAILLGELADGADKL